MNLETKNTLQALRQCIDMCMQRAPVDLLVKNARILDVFSGAFFQAPLAIGQGKILGFFEAAAAEVLDAQGACLVPGFIDGHVHIESSMLTPSQFSRIVLPYGTTTVVADPHEIANVLGMDGIRYMLESSEALPLDVRIALSSCVPATPFEDAGAQLYARDLAALMNHPRVTGLAEMMNYPGVLQGDEDVLEKIMLARNARKVVDGHSPMLAGHELDAYSCAGVTTDHECSTIQEMHDRILRGMYVLIRQGSAVHNLPELIKGVHAGNSRRCLFCTDDRQAADIVSNGHINELVRLAVSLGMDAITALTIATLNAAECYGLNHKGAIAPGRDADFMLLPDLESFKPSVVFAKGKKCAEQGTLLVESTSVTPEYTRGRVCIAPLSTASFCLPLSTTGDKSVQVRVIKQIPHSVLTECVLRTVRTSPQGCFDPSLNPGLVKLAVVERHKASGAMALGILEGYGLHHGAIATTIAHDSHNLVIAGCNDADMLCAAQALVESGGGICLCVQGVVQLLPLPVAGLMSDAPAQIVDSRLRDIIRTAHLEMGVNGGADAFMSLSFMTLPVIPDLKLTDRGLFDVRAFEFVPLVTGA